jgi:hypothetical protein
MIQLEDFWAKFEQKPQPENFIQEAIELFSTTFTEEEHEQYELGEMVGELSDRVTKARDYENLRILYNSLDNHAVFLSNKLWMAGDFIQYHLFRGEINELKPFVDFILENPLDATLVTFTSFYSFVLHQKTDLVNLYIETLLEEGKDNSVENMELFYASLPCWEQEEYVHFLETGNLSGLLAQQLAKFDWADGAKFIKEVSQTFQKIAKREKLKEPEYAIGFFIWMYEKGVPFQISRYIFGNLVENYCDGNITRKIRVDDFITACRYSNDHFIMEWEMFTAFTSVYFYEYLQSIGVIDDLPYRAKVFKEVRAHYANSPNFWELSYLFKLPKPETISEEEWQELEKTCRQSFEAPDQQKIDEYHKKYFANVFRQDPSMTKLIQQVESIEEGDEYTELPKIDRNKVVKVRYKDGTEKESKFKKLENDLKKGLCKLV